MSAATTTTQGEVVLSGDLAGGSDGNAPQLRATGVTLGTYTPVQRATVDAKGRLVSIGSTTASDVSAVLPIASSSLGMIKPGANMTLAVDGTLSFPLATSSSLGIFQVGSGLLIDGGGSITLDRSTMRIATSSLTGFVKIGNGLQVDAAGSASLNAPIASASTLGQVQLGTGLTLDASGFAQFVGVLGTNTVLGSVKPLNTSTITVVSGNLDVGPNIPTKITANTFTKAQVTSPSNYSVSGGFTADMTAGTMNVDATGSVVVSSITGGVPGAILDMFINNTTAGTITVDVTPSVTGGTTIGWRATSVTQSATQNIPAGKTLACTVIYLSSTYYLMLYSNIF